MKRRGEIENIEFISRGFKMIGLGIEYELRKYDEKKTVYVNTMKELKAEIRDYNKEYDNG
jgi:hypothetical protein